VVWNSTGSKMPAEKTCAGARSLIWAASSTSQATPEIMATPKPSQAMRRSRERHVSATPSVGRKTGPEIKAPKMMVPASISVAAKWIARTATSGPFTMASSAGQQQLRAGYRPTRKVKLPCVVCVSTERTRHVTR